MSNPWFAAEILKRLWQVAVAPGYVDEKQYEVYLQTRVAVSVQRFVFI